MTTPMGDMPSTFNLTDKVQIKRGNGNVNRTVNNTILNTKLLDGSGNPMDIQVQPEKDCFWRLRANVAFQGLNTGSGGIWQRVDYALGISPADANGDTRAFTATCLVFDSATVGWLTYSASGMFQLNAGVVYTASLILAGSTGFNQQYLSSTQFMRLVGRIVGEGQVL